MTKLSVVSVLLGVSACGALTPHVSVDAAIHGAVDTSGKITVTEDLNSLLAFFTTQCQEQLGPSATSDQVATCAATMTNDFISFAAGGTNVH